MDEESDGGLQLPSLSVRGFRGIGHLDIPRLGRVTLLAGKNGVGKTAVLESVRLYAARGREHALSAVLRNHEELVSDEDERYPGDTPAALFHGRDAFLNSRIEIGWKNASSDNRLRIEAVTPTREQIFELTKAQMFHDVVLDDYPLVMEISFAGRKWLIPWLLSHDTGIGRRAYYTSYWRFTNDQRELAPELICRSLGPGLLNNKQVAELWDEVTLTDDEEHAVNALNLVVDARVDRVTMIGDDRGREYDRRTIVKLRDRNRPVALRSLGDGAARLFGVALALADSRNGFLLIDEAENGIHHSVHDAFWRMVLQTAARNNVQVLATTHSFDCVRGFANAAAASPECEGILVRLEQDDKKTRAVVYSESEIRIAAEQGIEVR